MRHDQSAIVRSYLNWCQRKENAHQRFQRWIFALAPTLTPTPKWGRRDALKRSPPSPGPHPLPPPPLPSGCPLGVEAPRRRLSVPLKGVPAPDLDLGIPSLQGLFPLYTFPPPPPFVPVWYISKYKGLSHQGNHGWTQTTVPDAPGTVDGPGRCRITTSISVFEWGRRGHTGGGRGYTGGE
jgi:hypothetical protein